MRNQRGRRAGLAGILTGLFLLSSVALATAGDIKFVVSPAKIGKAGPVLVFASGLQPGQEVGLRTIMGEVLSDVSFLVAPTIQTADENGAFAGMWNIDKNTMKVMKPGTYTIDVVDADGNTLASAKLLLEKGKKAKKKK